MEDNNRTQLLRTTVILGLLMAIAGPLMYFFVDVEAANWARHDLSRPFVDAVKKTGNLDDCINAACMVMGLHALLRLRNKGRFQQFIFPPLSALYAGILTHLLKWPLGRWRPKALFQHDMYGFEWFGPVKASLYKEFGVHSAFCDAHPFARSGLLISFPSGHSSSMMAVMTAIAILQPRYRWPCFALGILFGTTRVIESAHYPSDVLGGLILGYLAAHWLRRILVKRNWLPDTAAGRA
jgi:membrane-associated phospholipid phosphatase